MDSLFNDYPELLRANEPPCLSLYQPTHRHHPDSEQDPIRFRNLVKTMEDRVRRQYSTREVGPLLEPYYALADDQNFWNHALDGLAILSAPGMFRCYRLQRPVKELAVVADSFHTKPLLRIIQSADRYQILALNRREIKLSRATATQWTRLRWTRESRRRLPTRSVTSSRILTSP